MEGTLVKRFPSSKRSKRIAVSPAMRAYIRKTEAFRAGREPIALMRTAPKKFARAVAGLSASQMRRRPARGKWSIIEILSHLNDTEVVYGYRYRMALAEPGSPIQGYDQDRWIDALRHRRGNAKRLLDQIRVARESNLEMLAQVPRRSWKKRYGMHSERGKETVLQTVELIAGHDLNHLSQIQAIRKKYGW
jgi:uncharacterized damage-inducible protein DinB